MKRLLTTTLVFCSAFILSGQEAAFTAEVNMDSVLIGNYIEVTFKIENVSNATIEAPDFAGFNIVSGPNYSSSMQVVNGAVSQSASKTYFLEPKDVGQFYIDPAQVKNGEELLETAPIEINVYHNPDGVVQTPPKKENEDSWFQWPERRRMEPKPKEKKQKKKRKTYRL